MDQESRELHKMAIKHAEQLTGVVVGHEKWITGLTLAVCAEAVAIVFLLMR